MDIRGLLHRYGDLLLAVLLAALFTTEVMLWDAADIPRAVPSAIVGALALALRRRTPLVAFLLAWGGSWGVLRFAPGLDNDSAGFILIFFISLYSLGRYSRGHEVWLGGLCVFGYILLFLLGDPTASVKAPSDVGFSTLFVGTPWAAGLAIRLRKDRERTLTAHNVRLREDQVEQARRAVAEERSRIARELHDVVSHAIAVTVLQARGGRKMLGVDEDAVRRSLGAIEHTNAQALGDMRRLLSLLRDAEGEGRDDPQPSLARLDSLLTQVREAGLPVCLKVTGDGVDVPPGVDLSAYRIIQEALTNVLKHAGPATATVTITYGEEDLDLAVTDDGVVGSNGDGRGQGLIGIRERVAVVGGMVKVGPGESGGFVVKAHLPYAVEA